MTHGKGQVEDILRSGMDKFSPGALILAVRRRLPELCRGIAELLRRLNVRRSQQSLRAVL